MACPYFWPSVRLGPGSLRLPLLDLYAGTCHADPAEPRQPPEESLREQCAFGYARAICDRFPSEAPVDAVRFSAARDQIVYILEKDHAPIEFGSIGRAQGILAAQARAFQESHLQRKPAALIQSA